MTVGELSKLLAPHMPIMITLNAHGASVYSTEHGWSDAPTLPDALCMAAAERWFDPQPEAGR